MSDWIDVAAVAEIPPIGLRVLVGDDEVLLVRTEGGVRALSYLCSHQDMPLEGGSSINGSWVCPHHGARFSLETGDALSMPAVSGVNNYKAKEVDGRVFIKF